MGTEVVDRLLSDWDMRLRRIDESLLALEAEPTYQMLAPRSAPRAPLSGETARRVGPALDALDVVFEYRGKLTEVLESAKEVRASMSGMAFWGQDDKEREIVTLLHGPSVEMPPDTTPLARRALLDPGARDVRVTPEQLLGAMARAYESARDAIIAVKDAWERAEPALASAERQVEDTRATAGQLGVALAVQDELAGIERELHEARVRIAQDPLGATAEVTARLGPRLQGLAAQLAAVAALRDRVEVALARARGTLAKLREVHEAAEHAVLMIPREVANAAAPGVPIELGLLDALAPWLAKLDAVAREGRFAAAEVGLARWEQAASGYLAADGAIAGALAALLGRRDELLGRLRARRAQAQAQARSAALDPSVEAVASEAERLLTRRPTPLAQAAALVERYEQAVLARPGR